MLIVQLIVVQGLTFVALMFVLKKVLYSQFKKSMDRLRVLNQETEKKRRELQEKLDQTSKDFEARVKDLEAQAERVRQEAEREAEDTRTRALAEARREADKLLEEARSQEGEVKRELEAGAVERAARLAVDALHFVFTKRLEQGLHSQLVVDLIEGLDKVDGKRLNGQGGRAEVALPYPLEPQEKMKLEETLERKAKRKITITSRVDESLVAGMVLTFDNVVLDGSLKTKLKEAIGYLLKAERRL